MGAFARSYIADAQELRAKTLRRDEAWVERLQRPRHDHHDREARKGICIAIFEQCSESYGLSMAEFVRRWGHKWATGHGYLTRDERRYPKARSVRKAWAVLEYLQSGCEQTDREVG